MPQIRVEKVPRRCHPLFRIGDEKLWDIRQSTGETVRYTAGPFGRITARDGAAFGYDPAGRRLEDDRFTYRWDWRGQLVEVTVKAAWPDGNGDGEADVSPYAGHRVSYAYDARGRLLTRREKVPPAFQGRLRVTGTEIAVMAAGETADAVVTTVETELVGVAFSLSGRALRGIGEAVRAAPNAAKREIVVVGEGRDRVNAVASQLRNEGFAVRTYPAPNMNRAMNPNAYGSRRTLDANWHWIDYWAREKQAVVIDIGPQPGRAISSPYYAWSLETCADGRPAARSNP